MDDKIITTSGGYKVTLAPFLTYDQFIEIQKLWTKDAVIDPEDKDKDGKTKQPVMGKIAANTVYDANKLAVGFLVKSIEDPKGQEVVRQDANALPIPPIDGQEVMEEIGKISDEAASAFDKKKAKTV